MDQARELITDEVLDAFRHDGAVLLPGVFETWVETLRAGVERSIVSPGPAFDTYSLDEAPGRFYGDYSNWRGIPEYWDFILESPAAAMAARLTGSTRMQMFSESVFIKEPGTLDGTPWHHDQPYTYVDGEKICSFWIPLDPVSRESCLECVAGSHKWGRWFAALDFDGGPYLGSEDHLEAPPDIEGHRDDYTILSWDMAPGDAIAFHFLTLHGAGPNRSPSHRRRGLAMRFADDDATYGERPWQRGIGFPDLAGKVVHEDPLPVDVFPVVWPRET